MSYKLPDDKDLEAMIGNFFNGVILGLIDYFRSEK